MRCPGANPAPRCRTPYIWAPGGNCRRRVNGDSSRPCSPRRGVRRRTCGGGAPAFGEFFAAWGDFCRDAPFFPPPPQGRNEHGTERRGNARTEMFPGPGGNLPGRNRNRFRGRTRPSLQGRNRRTPGPEPALPKDEPRASCHTGHLVLYRFKQRDTRCGDKIRRRVDDASPQQGERAAANTTMRRCPSPGQPSFPVVASFSPGDDPPFPPQTILDIDSVSTFILVRKKGVTPVPSSMNPETRSLRPGGMPPEERNGAGSATTRCGAARRPRENPRKDDAS